MKFKVQKVDYNPLEKENFTYFSSLRTAIFESISGHCLELKTRFTRFICNPATLEDKLEVQQEIITNIIELLVNKGLMDNEEFQKVLCDDDSITLVPDEN